MKHISIEKIKELINKKKEKLTYLISISDGKDPKIEKLLEKMGMEILIYEELLNCFN